jgi:predicted DNA-binding transcriptional regulator YafY
MPKSDNQKLKILYILDYLEKNSHEGHPVRASELISMLEHRHNILCERKTIYSDIAALQEYGVDIISMPGKNGGYFIGTRNFELSELKLLIDAVQSSRYLTEKKTRELIEKLCKQCNEHDARLMRRHVMVSGRVKSMNETIYYSVDTIQEAIAQNRQISFRYFDWGLDGKRKYRDKPYAASPYGLCQDNENCYLLAYSERHGVTSYRVDRMAEIQLSEDTRIPCPELTGKALTQYANRLFQMYQGQESQVKLRFRRKLVNAVMDKFGRDTLLIPDGEDHFVFTVNVAVSPMFLSWVIGFGEKARILYPPHVVEECRKLAQTAIDHHPQP